MSSPDIRRKAILEQLTTSLAELPQEEQSAGVMYVLRVILQSFCEASGINGKAAIATLALRGATPEELEGAFVIIRRLANHATCVCAACSPNLLDSAFEVIPKGRD